MYSYSPLRPNPTLKMLSWNGMDEHAIYILLFPGVVFFLKMILKKSYWSIKIFANSWGSNTFFTAKKVDKKDIGNRGLLFFLLNVVW